MHSAHIFSHFFPHQTPAYSVYSCTDCSSAVRAAYVRRCSTEISAPLPSMPSFFLRLLLEIRLWQDAYFPNTETCLQCSEPQHHPPSVSPLCHSSNNTPGTRSLAVTAPNPSFHSTDFWIKEGRFSHLWIVLCYGAHASFHASFLLRCASKWEHFLIYTYLERFWMGHGRLEHGWGLRQGGGGEQEWLLW